MYGKTKKRTADTKQFKNHKNKRKQGSMSLIATMTMTDKQTETANTKKMEELFEEQIVQNEQSGQTTEFIQYESKGKISYKKRSLWADVWIRLRKNKTAVFGIVLFIVILIACFLVPLQYNYEADVISIDVVNRLQEPSKEHLFGTDELGRDMLARILWGGRTSILAGVLSLGLGFLIGGFLGTIAAYYGDTVDTIIMRLVDIFMAIPSILLMITLAAIMTPNTQNLILAIGISLVPRQARIVRGQVLQIINKEYIEATRIQGSSDFKIIVSHILPNALSPVITTVILDIGYAITMISTLSYLGLGVQPPAPEWGSMLASSQPFMRDAWYITTFPGLALMITVVSLTLVGDGLRDALDPRMKR